MYCLRNAIQVFRCSKTPALSSLRQSPGAARTYLVNTNRKPDARPIMQRLVWQSKDPPFQTKNEADIVTSRMPEAGGAMRNVILNRPGDINVFDYRMMERLNGMFKELADRDQVFSVVLRAEGDHFSAGEDFAAIHEALKKKDYAWVERYFALRNEMLHRVALMPQAFYLVSKGITSGAAAAMALASSHCCSTATSVLAFPQTEHGWFVDGGATLVLSQLPYHMGFYLALTGLPLYGFDLRQAGVAEFNITSTESLEYFLARTYTGRPREQHYSALTCDVPGSSVQLDVETFAMLDRCFSKASVPEIMDALAQEMHPLAKQALGKMTAASPLSLSLTHQLLLFGTQPDVGLDDVFRIEKRISHRLMRGEDFAEGLQAYFERRPATWSIRSFADISQAVLDAFLAPFENKKLDYDPSLMQRPTRQPFDFFAVTDSLAKEVHEQNKAWDWWENFHKLLELEREMQAVGKWYDHDPGEWQRLF
eukprot:TRINITY_DN4300_c0_g1_i2.p1 TRINITY_DN4300_c0_g1~~TRINITY_DN4300_c0_g1_i2.p1  ORF type:complete len:480 (-),score=68.29 TRINITY_DN4300_c0_g1_i2:405-1844(-)